MTKMTTLVYSAEKTRKRVTLVWWSRRGMTAVVTVATAGLFLILLLMYNEMMQSTIPKNTTKKVIPQQENRGAVHSESENDIVHHITSLQEGHGEETNEFISTLLQSLDATERCVDPEDPLEWKNKDCTCSDPLRPRIRKTSRSTWMKHHKDMVKLAKKVRFDSGKKKNKKTNAKNEGLDVLFLGDSITERWMGTKAMGKFSQPELKQVFDQYFVKSSSFYNQKTKKKGSSFQATMNCAAFGTGGDTAPELLWHLEHGILAKNIQPRAILLLIGTNDLGLPFCSKRNVLASILNVAAYLYKQRPSAIMILHGLLPRNEAYGDTNFDLGIRWQQIQWINRELGRFAALSGKNWHYLENGDLFLRHDNPAIINATLMRDALHPSLQGYRLWAPRLAKQLQTILDQKDRSG